MLPPLSAAALGPLRRARFRLLTAGRPGRSYSRGRYALFDACRLAGVGRQGALLAPAYHCRTMIDPALRLGAEVRLYPAGADLAPDLDALDRLAGRGKDAARALLLTHYFGFPQALEAVSAFCAERGLALIEDCSHAFFNPVGRDCLGSCGQYTVASPYKFLPGADGGVLLGAPLPPAGRGAGLLAELRGLARIWQGAGRPAALPAGEGAVPEAAQPGEPGRHSVAAGAGPSALSALYDPGQEGRAGLRSSRWLLRCCDLAYATERRRAHYRQWLAAVAELPHCRALFPSLPEACVPYMFPLYIDCPEVHFYALKHLGVPVWRWDEMAVSDCPVAAAYRLHVLHLPCHQGCTPLQMEWMLAAVATALRRPAGKRRACG